MHRISLFILLATCLAAADPVADGDLPPHEVLAAPPIASYTPHVIESEGGKATIEGDVLHLVSPKHHGKSWTVSGHVEVEVPALPKTMPLLLRLEARAVSAKTESGKGEIWVFIPELIDLARRKAATEGTSLNERFRLWLAMYVGREEADVGYRRLMERLEPYDAGGTFTRDEMNER